jgi:DNA-binding NarL/FixJ family response regulator
MRRHSVSDKVVNVLVADTSPMVCELVANLFKRTPAINVVGWVVDSASALATIRDGAVDVALISADLQDGPGKGFSLAYQLRTALPRIRSIVLLDSIDRQSVLDAFRSGARGILSRGAGLAALVKCVCRVSDGQVWADTQTLTYLTDAAYQPRAVHTLTGTCAKLLTEREKMVVQLVADGLSNREIAEQLHLSPHTIRNYLFRVFDKVGVSTRIELVLAAISTSPTGARHDDDRRLTSPMQNATDSVGDA